MQKAIENNQERNHHSYSISSELRSFLTSRPNCPTPKFVGSQSIIKTRKYSAKTKKYYPWKSDAPLEKWLGSDNLDDKTIELRRKFYSYVRVSLNYCYYQFEPVIIPYFDVRDKKKTYQPLALLTYWNGVFSLKKRQSVLIDVQSDARIKENAEWMLPAFRATNYFAIKRKLQFRLFREDFFEKDIFSNILFIEPYMGMNRNNDDLNLIFQILEDGRKYSLDDLKEVFLRLDPERIEEMVSTTWSLIGSRFINADWSKDFDDNVVVWFP